MKEVEQNNMGMTEKLERAKNISRSYGGLFLAHTL